MAVFSIDVRFRVECLASGQVVFETIDRQEALREAAARNLWVSMRDFDTGDWVQISAKGGEALPRQFWRLVDINNL